MQLFPGRTPEELDEIDLPRVLRALEARNTVESVLQLRRNEQSDNPNVEIDWDLLQEIEAARGE